MQLVVEVESHVRVRLATEYVVSVVADTAAVAAAPEPPPLKLTVGADVYPLPLPLGGVTVTYATG
jgi:hypothetical protein